MTMTQDEHPDEGMIHAWLDRELSADAASVLEAHLVRCDQCAERVAEARGLIAGASRIIAELDGVEKGARPLMRPVTTGPSNTSRSAGDTSSAWRLLRVTPLRAAIAATLIVAVGLTLTHERTGPDTVPATVASAPRPTADRDHLLDSAVARNLAIAQPPRVLGPAPGVAVSPPGSPPPANSLPDTTARTRVAIGRTVAGANRDSAGFAADRASGAAQVGAEASSARVLSAAKAAERATSSTSDAPRSAAGQVTSAPAGANAVAAVECYRVEATSGEARWGDAPLPLVLAVQPGRSARVLTSTGAVSGTNATVLRESGDSLLFRLERAGYEGTIALGSSGLARAGIMRSHPTMMPALADVAVAPSPAAPTAAARRSRARADTTIQPQAQRRASPAETQDALSAAPAIPVVARVVACPNRER